MANNVKLSATAASAGVDGLAALLNSGYIRIYDGTQPATADAAVTTQVLLAELRFGATAFGAASSGVATANTMTDDASANATGTATWFRLLKSDGTTAVLDGTVGTAACDMNLTSTSIVSGQLVSLTAGTITQPLS